MRVSIVGHGAWGSAFGKVLQNNGHEVCFIGRDETGWHGGDPGGLVLLAVPCQALRSRLASLPPPGVPVAGLIKGIEIQGRLRVSQVVSQVWPGHAVAAVSGPTFAAEVQGGAPTAAVVAAEDEELARSIQDAAHSKYFRLYRSHDLVGVELGGALKNVYALAGGICQGLGIGDNGMAGLMTRCLAEMVRIACLMGAKQETLYGLSGMGDLILTAYSGQSRNYQVGVALGRGRELAEILEHLSGVAEGVPTTEAVHHWVTEHNVKAPVIHELRQVLTHGKPPARALEALITRTVEAE